MVAFREMIRLPFGSNGLVLGANLLLVSGMVFVAVTQSCQLNSLSTFKFGW